MRGTGIGLSVVNEFVNVHRGSIELVDGEFPGAHFRMRLPLRVMSLPAAGGIHPAAGGTHPVAGGAHPLAGAGAGAGGATASLPKKQADAA